MGFKQYAVKRILEAIPAILGILIIGFLAVHLTPGDPAQYIAGEGATEEQVALISHTLGLDKPLLDQLVTYFQNLLVGNLGYSFLEMRPVTNIIVERIANTLMLVFAALMLAVVLGVTLGVLGASKPYSLLDTSVTIVALTGYAMPAFWLAQMLLIGLAVFYPIFPAGGMTSVRVSMTGWSYIVDVMWHMVLPVATLFLVFVAEQFRFTRGSMLEVLSQDYITTARCKGVSERWVLFKHALRNALLPLVTVTGLRMGNVFTGAVLVEIVYGWPGVGRLMYDSVFARDYPVILGCFVFISMFVIVSAFITDIVYALLDPRIRYK